MFHQTLGLRIEEGTEDERGRVEENVERARVLTVLGEMGRDLDWVPPSCSLAA